MNTLNKNAQEAQVAKDAQLLEKFIVVGYVGEDLITESADSVVVVATNLDQALEKAGKKAGFNPVSGLRESELRKFLQRIEQHAMGA